MAGFMTTLMHASCLSRNVRYMAGVSSSPIRCVLMTDGIELTAFALSSLTMNRRRPSR